MVLKMRFPECEEQEPACRLLFVHFHFFLVRVRFDLSLRQVRAAEFMIERRKIRSLKRVPTLHDYRGIVLTG